MTNVIKHSRANNVEVLFAVSEAGLILTLRDDGIGHRGKNIPGRGIANMKSRAVEIGGTLDIDFRSGTCVRLKMRPMKSLSV